MNRVPLEQQNQALREGLNDINKLDDFFENSLGWSKQQEGHFIIFRGPREKDIVSIEIEKFDVRSMIDLDQSLTKGIAFFNSQKAFAHVVISEKNIYDLSDTWKSLGGEVIQNFSDRSVSLCRKISQFSDEKFCIEVPWKGANNSLYEFSDLDRRIGVRGYFWNWGTWLLLGLRAQNAASPKVAKQPTPMNNGNFIPRSSDSRCQ